MSIQRQAFEGASWLAFFKLITQIFSWSTTILVANILVPEDYGLMELATIITGYAAIFSELGLGAAIIQRPKPTKLELSSVFWFSFSVSIFFAIGCFGLAYLTAYVFHEPRVIPITKLVTIIFVLNGLQIVPLNLLKKKLDFKSVGIIEMEAASVSCGCTLMIAHLGGGVWSLVGGYIALNLARLILIFSKVNWRPQFHFNFSEAKPYVTFGTTVAVTTSLFYINGKSDRFFAGRVWEPKTLGYYSFAMQLAQMPTENIVSLINQVSFPALSKLQNNTKEFNKLYLNAVQITATLVLPIFVGGYLIGENIVKLLLNEKWFPIIFLFKHLCLVQIVTALTAINNFVHLAQGRPRWSLYFNIVRAILLPISFYFAVQYGSDAILIPWFTVYIITCCSWIVLTLRKIRISLLEYLNKLLPPIKATLVMAISVIVCDVATITEGLTLTSDLLVKIVIGAFFYTTYLWFFNRQLFRDFLMLRRK